MKYSELPHDNASEKGIFSIIFQFPDKFPEIVDELTASDFYVPAHQQIWQAMTELFTEGKDIDFPNLRIYLQKAEIDPRPSLEAAAMALDEEVRDAHLPEFIKQIKNKSLLRQIVKASQSHAYTGQLEGTDALELLNTAEKDLLAILDKTKDTQPVDATGIVEQVQADIDAGMKNGWQGFDTGFKLLDKNTGGFIPSQIWILGAYTGYGKTFHILQMLLNVLRQGGRVILFSTEMDRKLNMIRLLGNIAGLGTIQIMRNQLSDEEKVNLEKAKKELSSFSDRLIIYDNINTVEGIRMKTKKFLLNGGVNVVAIDYIQQIRDKGEIYERMAKVATDLQQMALELKVTLLIGSQVPNDAVGGKNKESIDFKGAGEIAAIADVALSITKEKGKDISDRLVMMRKIRHGVPGKIHTRLEFPSGRVVDVGTQGAEEGESASIRSQLEAQE